MAVQGSVGFGTIFLMFVTSLVAGWLGLQLGKKIFRPITRKSAHRFKLQSVTRKSKDFTAEDILRMFRLNLKHVPMSDTFRSRMSLDLRRLGSSQTPEEIRKTQIVLCVGPLILSIVFYLIFPVLGVCLAVSGVYGWFFPVREVRKKIIAMNKVIDGEFPKFYHQVYYAYYKDTRANFRKLVNAYMLMCSREFHLELKFLLSNVDTMGDIEALRYWKRNLPLPNIIRFCEIMENRLNGENNIAVMESFLTQLERYREIQLERDCARAEKTMDGIISFTYIPFFALAAVYFFAQLQGSGFSNILGK